MVTCPMCDAVIDVDEEDLDEGDPLSCDECGASIRVVGVDPIELESDDDADDDDEDFDDFDDEDEDEDEDEEEEEDW
jgi:alpha-aminoadipate/glutamate carrier protein LysW